MLEVMVQEQQQGPRGEDGGAEDGRMRQRERDNRYGVALP